MDETKQGAISLRDHGGGVVLEILIPTFRRPEALASNLAALAHQVRSERLGSRVAISISDNASRDSTRSVCEKFIGEHRELAVRYSERSENCGLEENALGLLKDAAAPNILFLSDDDRLPKGYLTKVVATLSADHSISCVIPGYANVYPDGKVVTRWCRPSAERRWPAGWMSIWALANRGHQMSGIGMRRDGLVEGYLRDGGRYRSVHLFTAFLTLSLVRGAALVLGQTMIEVHEGAKKYWSTDSCGLLRESYLSFHTALDGRWREESLAQISAFVQQPFRLRWRSPRKFYSAVRDVATFEFTRTATVMTLLAVAGCYTVLLPLVLAVRRRGEGGASLPEAAAGGTPPPGNTASSAASQR